MRRHPVHGRTVWCAGFLAVLLLAATAWPLTVMAGEENEAGLVVQFGDGRVDSRCITFEEELISGAELLARSGLEVVLDPASSMGVTVCQIEGEGCAVPAEACFCQCMGGGECAYWNYFYRDESGGEWVYSALGAALRKVGHGSVEAWVWGDGGSPPTDELRFEDICGTAGATAADTPEPPTPLPSPTLPRAQEGELAGSPTGRETGIGGMITESADAANRLATPALTAGRDEESPASSREAGVEESQSTTHATGSQAEGATALPSPPTEGGGKPDNERPAYPTESSGSNVASYWPFGLMLAALAVAGIVLWRRRG